MPLLFLTHFPRLPPPSPVGRGSAPRRSSISTRDAREGIARWAQDRSRRLWHAGSRTGSRLARLAAVLRPPLPSSVMNPPRSCVHATATLAAVACRARARPSKIQDMTLMPSTTLVPPLPPARGSNIRATWTWQGRVGHGRTIPIIVHVRMVCGPNYWSLVRSCARAHVRMVADAGRERARGSATGAGAGALARRLVDLKVEDGPVGESIT